MRRVRWTRLRSRVPVPCGAGFLSASDVRRRRLRGALREGLNMCRFRLPIVVVAVLTAIGMAGTPAGLASARSGLQAAATPPVNVDVSQRHLNESEEAIAVNPVNPGNIVTVTNVGHAEAGLTAGMFEGISFDGGKTWTRKLIALGPVTRSAMDAATRACPSTATGTCS